GDILQDLALILVAEDLSREDFVLSSSIDGHHVPQIIATNGQVSGEFVGFRRDWPRVSCSLPVVPRGHCHGNQNNHWKDPRKNAACPIQSRASQMHRAQVYGGLGVRRAADPRDLRLRRKCCQFETLRPPISTVPLRINRCSASLGCRVSSLNPPITVLTCDTTVQFSGTRTFTPPITDDT